MPITDTNLQTIAGPSQSILAAINNVQVTIDGLNQDKVNLSAAALKQYNDDQAAIQALKDQIDQLNLSIQDKTRADLVKATCIQGLQRWKADPTTSKEQFGVWIDSGGHTAQTNPGTSTTPHGTFTWTPGDDQRAARFDFEPGAAWDDVFIYERQPLPAYLPEFFMDRRVMSFNASDLAALNQEEWQQQLTWKDMTYNMAWAINFGSKQLRYFDYNAKVWKSTGVNPFSVVTDPTKPFEIVTEHSIEGVWTTHIAATINGTRFPINVKQPASATAGASDKYTVSLFQIDSDSHGDKVGINLHQAESRYL